MPDGRHRPCRRPGFAIPIHGVVGCRKQRRTVIGPGPPPCGDRWGATHQGRSAPSPGPLTAARSTTSMRTVLLTFPEVDHPTVPGHLQALPQQLRCRSQTTADRGGRLALFRRQLAGMLRVDLLDVPHLLAQDRAAASPQSQLDVRIPDGQKLECRQLGPLGHIHDTMRRIVSSFCRTVGSVNAALLLRPETRRSA